MVTLIIVESPAKAKKIGQILGREYIVRASMGHINELAKENMGIDIENNFEPSYSVIAGKAKVIKELKDVAKTVDNIILAGDADREGEAISWHVANVLKLPVGTTPRIIFHEITKPALLSALANPTILNMDLVNAQQARAVLDKLVGFEISPILWKQIQPSLSAGRVQTPLLHLIMEREKEIEKFKSSSYFRTTGTFFIEEKSEETFVGVLEKKFEKIEEVRQFLTEVQPADFFVTDIKRGTKTKKPAPPFTTASLLQDAGGKLRMSSKQIMDCAQKLYESGKITYHRTDSTNLSKEILNDIKNYVVETYGQDYVKLRTFKTKTKCAQEAHEAIRPTHIEEVNLEDDANPNEKKLYSIIWKRTVASQMAEATFATLHIRIGNSVREEIFMASAENCTFEGYLKVYNYQQDDNKEEDPDAVPLTPYEVLSGLKNEDVVLWSQLSSEERVTQGPGHYNEAQLIKQMQDTGIGRPSTYSSMINKIQERGYVVKENRAAGKATMYQLNINPKGIIKETSKEVVLKKEMSKLFPTDTGKITDTFMSEQFNELVVPKYTADLEEQLDSIANGENNWRDVVSGYYQGFHPKVEHFMAMKRDEPKEKSKHIRVIGNDSEGNQIVARIGPYGAIVQSGSKEAGNVKYATLEGSMTIETVTLGEAIELLKYPKSFGMYNAKPLILKKGKFGPYLEYNEKTYSLKNAGIDIDDVDREKAIEIITTNDGYVPKPKSPEKPIAKKATKAKPVVVDDTPVPKTTVPKKGRPASFATASPKVMGFGFSKS